MGHNFKATVIAPTCTASGYTTYTCSVCGNAYKDNYVDSPGHSHGEAVVENEVEATCTTVGSYDNVVYCTVCGKMLSRETVTVAALGHTAGDAVIENEVAADHVNNGSYDNVVYCTVCKVELSRETVTVGAQSHTAGATVVENEVKATCTTAGSYDNVVYCTDCGKNISRETVTVAAPGHTDGEVVVENTVAADCVNDGSYDNVVRCSVCDVELSRETVSVKADGHNYETEVTAPTYTEAGYTTYTCSRCGDSYVADEVPAIGSTPGGDNTGGGNTGGGNTGGSTGGQPYGPGPESTPVQIPVSNDNVSIDVEISISKETVIIAPPSQEALKQITGSEEAGGDVVIDLSELDAKVHGVEIPAQLLKEIDNASKEDSKEEKSDLEIKLPTGTLTFDSAAVDAILKQSNGKNVQIHLEDVGIERLNDAQKKALQGKDVRKGLEAYITVDGKHVSDFEGGCAQMDVTVPRGKNDRSEGFTVWFVAKDGRMEKLNSWYDGKTKTFTVGHFSDYVIIYEDPTREDFLTCTYSKECPLHSYVDLSANAWYHDGVHYCLENGLMVGCGDNQFLPGGEATRAMVITMLWRLSGSPVMRETQTFTDVEDGQWYSEAIRWAKTVGITKGYGDGRFGVHDSVTREQLAVFLYQYARYKGYSVSGGDKSKILSYSDIFDVNEYAIYALQWACGNGVIHGEKVNGETLLLPGSFATRAQLATMMMRLRTEATE